MEYGSDFSVDLGGLRPAQDTVFAHLRDFNSLYFDSARSSIRYLLKHISHTFVALPDYLCDSILACFAGSKKCFYSVNEHLKIEQLDHIPWEQIDVFYLLHYFGCVQDAATLEFLAEKKKQYGFVIIEDTTHSIFSKQVTIGDYCICSLRKWFPVPDGGVLYARRPIPESLYLDLPYGVSDRISGMVLKSLYLQGRLDCKPLFREILLDSEELLEKQTEIQRISPVSEMILHCTSVRSMTERRKENYACMKECIGDLLPEPFLREETGGTPFAYVVHLNERDELRKYLIRNNIYCAVHGPCPAELDQPGRIGFRIA